MQQASRKGVQGEVQLSGEGDLLGFGQQIKI